MNDQLDEEWMVNLSWEEDGVHWQTSWIVGADTAEEAAVKAREAFNENVEVGAVINTRHLKG